VESIRGSHSQRLSLAGSVVAAVSLLIAAAAWGATRDSYEVRRAPSGASMPRMATCDDAWSAAEIITWGPQERQTTFRALWSDAGLFVCFEATDPQPWYTLTRRDARLWEEEVVELFIARDAAERYVEIEINPANTVADLRIDSTNRKFDLSWDFAGLDTRVNLRRDAAGRIAGWTAVAWLPWNGFIADSQHAGAAMTSPAQAPQARAGDRWFFNVFRIERPGGAADPQRDALLLAWSPTGRASFHVREAFREMILR